MKLLLATCAKIPPEAIGCDLALKKALDHRGVETVLRPWDQIKPQEEAKGHAAGVVVRSVWDYTEQSEKFFRWIHGLRDEAIPVINEVDLLLWNSNKRYLLDLIAHGVPCPVTRIVDQNPDIETTASEIPGDRLVLKPCIGESGVGVTLVERHQVAAQAEALRAETGRNDLLLQEFMPEIREGELSLVFIDGHFAHGVRKRPNPDDFRVNGRYRPLVPVSVVPEKEHVAAAEEVLRHVPGRPVYARIDGILRGGQFVLMEIEVIDPALYLDMVPASANALADAIVAAIRAS